jgi:hypothetical protein
MELEGSISNSQELSTFLSQTNPVHITPSHLYKIHPDIIQPPTVFLVASFPLTFPPTTYTRFSFLPFLLYAPPISSSSPQLLVTLPICLLIKCCAVKIEARGSEVVKALSYKPEGRGFHTRWGEWFFSIYLIPPGALSRKVMLLGNKARPVRKADKVTPCVSRLSRPTMAIWRPAAWFTPSPAKSQVYFKKS